MVHALMEAMCACAGKLQMQQHNSTQIIEQGGVNKTHSQVSESCLH